MNSRKSIAECNKFLRLFFNKTLILLLLSMFSINAAPLAEHQKNVQAARALTAELTDYIDETEAFDDIDAEYEKEIIAKIHRALPAAEKIEWQGATIENGNEWLATELAVYANEKNLTKRSEILDSIGERLGALEAKLVELEKAVAADRTKDEDKQKLAEILRRAEYQKPEPKQESLFQRWWQAFTDWLAGVFPRPKISETNENGSQSISFVLQILLYALVLSVIGFLLYRFAPVLLKNRRKIEKPEKKERVILGERVAAGESAENLFGEAERLARDGDLRAAIRKGYIALLCDLNDRRVIGLAQHKTNRDYLRDVSADRALYENVGALTGSFERHWYGEQNAAEKDWNEFREIFRETVKVR